MLETVRDLEEEARNHRYYQRARRQQSSNGQLPNPFKIFAEKVFSSRHSSEQQARNNNGFWSRFHFRRNRPPVPFSWEEFFEFADGFPDDASTVDESFRESEVPEEAIISEIGSMVRQLTPVQRNTLDTEIADLLEL